MTKANGSNESAAEELERAADEVEALAETFAEQLQDLGADCAAALRRRAYALKA